MSRNASFWGGIIIATLNFFNNIRMFCAGTRHHYTDESMLLCDFLIVVFLATWIIFVASLRRMDEGDDILPIITSIMMAAMWGDTLSRSQTLLWARATNQLLPPLNKI